MRRSTHHPKVAFSHDLHVLSTPPAFVLSQDQTLQFKPGVGSDTEVLPPCCSVSRMSRFRPKSVASHPHHKEFILKPVRLFECSLVTRRDRTLFSFQGTSETTTSLYRAREAPNHVRRTGHRAAEGSPAAAARQLTSTGPCGQGVPLGDALFFHIFGVHDCSQKASVRAGHDLDLGKTPTAQPQPVAPAGESPQRVGNTLSVELDGTLGHQAPNFPATRG